MSTPVIALLTAVAVLAGGAASVVGFGIGSLLTPLLAAAVGTDRAIAMVAIPHAAATLVRAWRLRSHVDGRLLVRFGLLSAAGALVGAVAYATIGPGPLTMVLGALLLLTATAGISGWTDRWRPKGPLVWMLGLASGLFGGLAGNQGGLRAAALGTFGLSPAAFVATATATGVLVDLARTPVYVARAFTDLGTHAGVIAILTAGTLTGTFLGERLLFRLPRARFRLVLSVATGALGVWLIAGTMGR